MADQKSEPGVSVAGVPLQSLSERHLGWLRNLLHRDYLTGADWDGALRQTAEMARTALEANEAFIAIHDPVSGRWTARTSRGDSIVQEAIGLLGSLSVIESVRSTGEPVLTTAEAPLLMRSKSISRNEIRSVLAVPIRWWERGEDSPKTVVGGCLYADRKADAAPFTPNDIQLVTDITRIAERSLNLLRHISRISNALSATREEVGLLREVAAGTHRMETYSSIDPGFVRDVIEPLKRAASVDKVGILMLGPTGSGKSRLARDLHYSSSRAAGPFVTLDCGQITSAEGLGADLFGFAKKSGFSAPSEGRPGRAMMANKGTLFVDEVGSLPLELQQRILRLIQTGLFSPLGSSEEMSVDIRLLAAANHDLGEKVRKGEFREDLFWRISEVTVTIPPLDERRADIRGLADHFLSSARERCGQRSLVGFTEAAYEGLESHPWSSSGNIRGLEHTITRSVLLAPQGTAFIDAPDVLFQWGPHSAGGTNESERLPAEVSADDRLTLLSAMILKHAGNVLKIASDPKVIAAFGSGNRPVPVSTLLLRIRQTGLNEALSQSRKMAEEVEVASAREAVLAHGDTASAARSLGLSRDQLIWRLRRAGLTVRQIVGDK